MAGAAARARAKAMAGAELNLDEFTDYESAHPHLSGCANSDELSTPFDGVAQNLDVDELGVAAKGAGRDHVLDDRILAQPALIRELAARPGGHRHEPGPDPVRLGLGGDPLAHFEPASHLIFVARPHRGAGLVADRHEEA